MLAILTCKYFREGALCHAPWCFATRSLWNRAPSPEHPTVPWRSGSIQPVPVWQELITEIILAHVLTPFSCQMEVSHVSIAQFCSTGIEERGNSKVSNGTIRHFHLLPCQAAFAGARSNCELLDCFPEMSCCLVHSEKINTHIWEISSCLASLAVSAEGPRETNGPRLRWNCSAPSGADPFSPKLSSPDGATYGNSPFCSCCSIPWINKGLQLWVD